MEKNKYDASSIDFSRCDMDGATLCNCALEELRLVFGPLGDQLHAQLRDLSKSRPGEPRGLESEQGGWDLGRGYSYGAPARKMVGDPLPASASLQLF